MIGPALPLEGLVLALEREAGSTGLPTTSKLRAGQNGAGERDDARGRAPLLAGASGLKASAADSRRAAANLLHCRLLADQRAPARVSDRTIAGHVTHRLSHELIFSDGSS